LCHGQGDQWENSAHAVATSYPTGSGRGSCVKCHSGKGFIYEYDADWADHKPDGSEEDLGYMPITCQTCHDPHSADNEHQLRVLDDVQLGDASTTDYEFTVSAGGNGMLCMNCHKSRRDAVVYVNEAHGTHYGPHHGTQTDMLFGTNAIEFGLPMGSSPHKDVVENTCVTCHMNEYDSHSSTKEDDVRDDFNNPGLTDAFTDTLSEHAYSHTFSNSYTHVAGADTTEYDNLQACQGCHGDDIESFDDIMANEDYDGNGTVEGVQSEVEGLLRALAVLLPPYGEPEVDEDSEVFTALERKAAYNYYFVEEDGSYGVHNAAYATGILKAAINALGVGQIGAGAITSITDVPNDQGRQVHVAWAGFTGDGQSEPNITKYGVWRKVEDSMGKAAPGKLKQVDSYDDMFAQIDNAEGMFFKVGESEVWDFVREVPAAGLASYSTVASTLFDSTIVGGQHFSYFRISGHGSNNAVVMSVADSGYSVDNLAPAAPQSMSFHEAVGKVVLEWSEPVDADFNYFAIYRSASSGFTPGEENRLGFSTENAFEDESVAIGTYYYVISAFDFSGNEGDFSDELAAAVTSVDGDLLPDEFGLAQNYPNPFNPTTVIPYQLPVAADVRLTIYNVLGQEVRTLVHARETAGAKRVIWDARDNRGKTVTPGVYIYRLRAGDFVSIRKMILLK